MPDSVGRAAYARLRGGLAILAVIIIILGVTTIALLMSQTDAVQTLRQSSARGECRTQIKNDTDNEFQHLIAHLIEASTQRDRAAVQADAQKLAMLPNVQDKIDAVCPKPIATPTTLK